jgi:MoaA/NifB/PqqE/SkfB family radical SAM enzyme
MKNKKYKVVSLHPYTACNMNCPFCYKKQDCKVKEKPRKFWYDLIPYLKQLTNQVAVGGGEPTTNIPFVKKFSALCKKSDLLCNITSNGRILMDLNDRELKDVLKNITMISISFDEYKIKTQKDLNNYIQLVKRIKDITKCQVGSNLLVNKKTFENKGINFIKLVDNLFRIGINRVFALCPKNIPCPDILKFKLIYQYLSIKHKHFYIDDATKMVLEEGKYSNWKKSCHRGKGLISINEDGGVSSCSFAKPFTYIKKPSDILNLKIPKEEIECHSCPFLNIK